MASQIIFLASSVLDAIIDHRAFHRLTAFGARGMEAKTGMLPDGSRVLRVEVDRLIFCPEMPNSLSDDVYAILLAAAPMSPNLIPPESLPESLVLHLLDEVDAALQEFAHLTGHDRLEIAAAISHARRAMRVTRLPRRSAPIGAKEAARLEQASILQRQLQPALARLDRRLAVYGEELRRHRLEAAVVRLGLQADLGASLRLDSVNGGLLPRLAGPHRRGEFRKLWQATLNQLAAFQSCLDRIHRASSEGSNWLADDALLPLHGTLLSQLVPPDRCGRYRSPLMRVRSSSDGSLQALDLPAEDVPEALDAFARGFDAELWKDLNPLVRIGHSHIDLMALHPYGDGNGRLGRLLLHAMLIENRVPGLPLEAVLTWNRRAYLQRVDAAVREADLLGFMQFLLKAADKAIDLGRHFIRELAPDRDMLLGAFAAGGTRFATIAAEYAGSMLLGPDAQLAQRAMNPDDLCRYLQDAGFDPVPCGSSDVCGYRIDTAWSCPLARDLLRAPPAMM
jgi:hypothetical protein